MLQFLRASPARPDGAVLPSTISLKQASTIAEIRIDKMFASLRQACVADDSNDVEAMLRQVRNLVPEYR